jgi:hypothetical protein
MKKNNNNDKNTQKKNDNINNSNNKNKANNQPKVEKLVITSFPISESKSTNKNSLEITNSISIELTKKKINIVKQENIEILPISMKSEKNFKEKGYREDDEDDTYFKGNKRNVDDKKSKNIFLINIYIAIYTL